MESNRRETQDRISGLPDHIIHHILSFLPSTKDAIRTTVLSKRWENQWTHVPVLIFDSTGMSYEKFLKFIDNTLISHDCSKINKFRLGYLNLDSRKDPQFTQKVHFATSKNVEDLNLSSIAQQYRLPQFLFNHASLVQLTTVHCTFMPNAKVNWGCLTVLIMEKCKLSDQAMDLIVSGSPLLKSFDITNCVGFKKVVIASKALKRLVFKRYLKSLHIEISCPILEEFELSCYMDNNVKFRNLPSSLCATLDFWPVHYQTNTREIRKSWIKDILHQLRHVKELTIRDVFSMVLVGHLVCSEGWTPPMLNIKCLTLYSTMLISHGSKIPCVFHNTPRLERLVICTPYYPENTFVKSSDLEKDYWNSDVIVFNCLVSHLKTIEINGFPKGDDELKFLLINFVRFLLKNARVLEKMVVELKDFGTGSALEVSQELSRLPRCSQDSIIEVICSK